MKGLGREFREALRLFVRSPAFVAAVVLPMALALGANTALFTVIRGVALAQGRPGSCSSSSNHAAYSSTPRRACVQSKNSLGAW